jgi:hypothetical protein
LSKQSKPANPSDLLTHPAVVHAIKQAARRLSRLSVFRRVDREDIMADLRLEVAIRLQVFDPALSSIGTFSTKAAHNGAVSMLRARSAESRSADSRTVSVECIGHGGCSCDTALSDAFARTTGRHQRDFRIRIEREDSIRALMATLSPTLAQLAIALSDGSPNSACRRLGISYRQCGHGIEQIRVVCESKEIGP